MTWWRVALSALPALSVLYSALTGVWGWPYARRRSPPPSTPWWPSWARSSAFPPRAITKPMAQASDILAVAVREIGTVEQSGNRQKYGKAYGMDGLAKLRLRAYRKITDGEKEGVLN